MSTGGRKSRDDDGRAITSLAKGGQSTLHAS